MTEMIHCDNCGRSAAVKGLVGWVRTDRLSIDVPAKGHVEGFCSAQCIAEFHRSMTIVAIEALRPKEEPMSDDKTTWGPGPWQDEPDRVEWRHEGLPCLAKRSPSGGAWCGYVAVPPGHPLHGKDYDEEGTEALEVHGGLTHSDACRGDEVTGICHVPQPGEPADVWWFGFDCDHWCDIAPARQAKERNKGFEWPGLGQTYKPLAYVTNEVNYLAKQLAVLAEP